jgi:predicted amidohydrolase
MTVAEIAWVAAVAMESQMGDVAANLARVEHWARIARERGARFAVFPEQCLTGSLNKTRMPYDQAREVADTALRLAGPRLEQLARELTMTLAVGVIEPGRSRESLLRNSVWLAGPEGWLGSYAKVHLPNERERSWFEPGGELLLIESQGWKFSIGICADLNYPEVFRAAAVAGADFFLLAVGSSGRAEDAALAAQELTRVIYNSALCNGLDILLCNQAGPSMPGIALCCDHRGQVTHLCTGEGLIVAQVNREQLLEARRQGDPTNVCRIRPEVYASIRAVSPAAARCHSASATVPFGTCTP